MPCSALIVDDSADIRLVVKSYLEEFDMDVSEATGGTEALELFSHRAFDVVFVDLVMPEMDGPEVIERLRQIEGNKADRRRSYIVVVSGSIDKKDWHRAKTAGANASLNKPFNMKDLNALMDNIGVGPA